MYRMEIFIISIGGLLLAPFCTAHSLVAEYKHLDRKIMNMLFRPRSEETWDKILQSVEYYTMKLMNYGMRISQEMESDKPTVLRLVKYGLPKFVNYTLNEAELMREAFIPYEKIEQFYNYCEELTRTWVEFVRIANAMKYTKHTKKPYIVQCAFHGRRLGKRKGAKKPHSVEKAEIPDKTEELIYTKESDWSKD